MAEIEFTIEERIRHMRDILESIPFRKDVTAIDQHFARPTYDLKSYLAKEQHYALETIERGLTDLLKITRLQQELQRLVYPKSVDDA